MTENTKFLNIKNNRIFLQTFIPEHDIKAIIQINHGLAEHSERYIDFARFLSSKGYAVYVHDHPGHGKSVVQGQKTGHLPWKEGWDMMLNVIHSINKTIRKKHPQIPVFLMGHSMGSLLSRYYNATFPMYFKGMIISGTTEPGPLKLKASLAFARTLAAFHKTDFYSKKLNNTLYKGFNRSLNSPKTDFDWLSTNEEAVKKYIQDPLCGFPLSLGFFKNLLQGSLQMLKAERNLRFRKNFSTLIISGVNDPVGNYGKDPKQVYDKYISQGFFRTQLQLIEGRHEPLHESLDIKQSFYDTIEDFIVKKLQGSV